MKATQDAIVLYGHDARLLNIRKWALESRGYRVLTVQNLGQLDRVPRTTSAALLVLCHTLSQKQCDQAVKRAAVRWPQIQSLSLLRDGAKRPKKFFGRIPETFVGATRLLSTVSELVGTVSSSPYSHTY